MNDRLTSPKSLNGTLWTGRERDACGMGFVARRDGVADARVVQLALDAVERIAHRGAVDAGDGDGEPTGDGAGIMLQVPWELVGIDIPVALTPAAEGRAALGMLFLPRAEPARSQARELIESVAGDLGATVIGWRAVPTDETALGAAARATVPSIEQVVVGLPESLGVEQAEAFLYRLRRCIEAAAGASEHELYVASLSSRTVVYKGLVVGAQLRRVFPDLVHPELRSSIAVFHQRYSTNTFPTWNRAQPCRTIAHNGEINTLVGNMSWMRAREHDLGWKAGSAGTGDDGSWIAPVVNANGSDSAMLDDAVQLLTHGGRTLVEALTMLVPPAWDHDQDLDPTYRDLLRVLSAVTEPWDGPAAIAFSNGIQVGACLDRNGLRPARWFETDDGIVACASETGAVPVDPQSIIRSGRLGPGQVLVVDTSTGALHSGDDVLKQLAAHAPWGIVAAAQQIDVHGSADPGDDTDTDDETPLIASHALHGYTREELTAVLRPMAQSGKPPVGSMGDDTPLAVFSDQPRSLFGCLRQGFAEVTNPAIDPLRERASMSLYTLLGPRPALLDRSADARPALRLASPIITEAGLVRMGDVADRSCIRVRHLSTTMARADGAVNAAALQRSLSVLCADAEHLVREGADVLVLDDRAACADLPPLPALLAGSAVHQHLLDAGLRTRVGLVQVTGEVREPHHVAALIGHGIGAVCPWLALATARDLTTGRRPKVDTDAATAQSRVVTALDEGLRTVMSRMGISTLDGYRGAQVFEAVGIDEAVGQLLQGTPRRGGSIGFAWIARRIRLQAEHAHQLLSSDAGGAPPLPSPGFYKFKRDGELHAFAPSVVAALHHAVRVDDVLGAGLDEARMRWRDYVQVVRDRPPIDLRDALVVSPGDRRPVPLNEVESARDLVRRFSTGAMSLGSIAAEAHETIALGAHLVGAWSNSGEGGEDQHRFGTDRNSDIKQVASGRFGVTPAYLRSARELQIKIAQGSKPGEGGHLPGHKVTDEIARIRHTQPGVSLISPPPHHDIYSIEDLAQLIHDLACANPNARSSVKLVSQAGIGTIAAGVAKAHADVIVVSGANGGTGASPLGSIKHAGMPWEWGLSETQQVLVANRLRGRVRLRVDGGLRTGRDVLVAALLGADEFSFGTAALIADGCTMARTCHNDNCPVGIATQRRELRELFPGRPDQVGAFLLLAAEELRELLAALGARTLDEVIGRIDLLHGRSDDCDVDLDLLLAEPDVPRAWPRRAMGEPNDVPGVDDGLDARLSRELWPALLSSSSADTVRLDLTIDNTDRSIGARVSGDIAERLDPDGLDGCRAHVHFKGSAGQSFGAFSIRGLRLELVGEANDFVGKGLAGAHLDLRFPDGSRRASAPSENVLAGNACLYGATSGLLLVAGTVGERFAVRNSGADAVVEGAGDHLCEYMTDGTIVVLGSVGRNVASGMSGGLVWVLDDEARLRSRLAHTAMIIEPDELEIRRLHELLELHRNRTGSPRAHELIADEASWASQLHCIAPCDRIVAAQAQSPIVDDQSREGDSRRDA